VELPEVDVDEPRCEEVEVDVVDVLRDGVEVREVLVLRPSLSTDWIDVRVVPVVLTREVIVVLVREGAGVAVELVELEVLEELEELVEVEELEVLEELDELVELVELEELEELEVLVELDELDVEVVRLELAAAVSRNSAALRTTRCAPDPAGVPTDWDV